MNHGIKLCLTATALRSAGHLENVQPELQPIKDTEVENIFYCSSVFGQLDM
jgi:hypothetical protein